MVLLGKKKIIIPKLVFFPRKTLLSHTSYVVYWKLIVGKDKVEMHLPFIFPILILLSYRTELLQIDIFVSMLSDKKQSLGGCVSY